LDQVWDASNPTEVKPIAANKFTSKPQDIEDLLSYGGFSFPKIEASGTIARAHLPSGFIRRLHLLGTCLRGRSAIIVACPTG